MKIQIALILGALVMMLRPAVAQTELMVNGGFESSTIAPWAILGTPSGALNVLSVVNPHSGTQCALLANGNTYSQNVFQTIVFPTNLIAATFSFYFDVVTSDPNTVEDAYFSFYITDVSQNVLANFGRVSNLNPTGGYVRFTNSLVTYNGSPNLTYAGKTVQVHFVAATDGYGSDTQFYLDDVSMQVATTANIPVNDDFTNAMILTGNPITLFANNTYATKEPGEPNHAGNTGGHSLWWIWAAPTNGIVSLNNSGSSFQTLLAVYTGGVLTNLTAVIASNNSTNTTLTFKAAAGTQYDVAVDGYNGATGNIVLNLAFAPDVTPPKVTITAPAAGANLTNSFTLIQGKASDNIAVAQVQYRLENASGTNAYQVANGTTNWSATVTNLIPGPNMVRTRAIDTSGNISASLARTFNYVVVSPLNLTINGHGTVSGATNGQLLHVGANYKITAKPKTGFGFAGWTGDIVTNTPALNFAMHTNLALVVNFVDITKPTVTITNPAKATAVWSNVNFTISGKAADNVAVSNVFISLNGATGAAATLTNHGSNWLQLVTLIPGTNTIAAYAVDTSGNVSLTHTVKIIYKPTAIGNAAISGNGSLKFDAINCALKLVAGEFHTKLKGNFSGEVVIERSSDLTHWTPFSTNPVTTNGIDLNLPLSGQPMQFIRARTQ